MARQAKVEKDRGPQKREIPRNEGERALRHGAGGLGGVLVGAAAIGALCCGEDTKPFESCARKLIGHSDNPAL